MPWPPGFPGAAVGIHAPAARDRCREASMDREVRGDVADVLARIGRQWGWVLAFGIVTLVVGVLVLIWPDRTVVALAVLFGIQLVLAGIFRFVMALAADDESGTTRVLLALLLGIFWIVNGAIELFTALSHRAMPSRGWMIFMGLLSIVAGVVALVYPGISLLALAIVLGVWLLVFGIMEIFLAFRARSVGRAASRIAATTSP